MTVFCTLSVRSENTRAAKDRDREQLLPPLLRQLGLPADIPIKRDQNGRLGFPQNTAADLSLSHADPLTAYAVGTSRLGIDLEAPDRLRDPLSLAARFFTEAERQKVRSATDLPLAACEIWTKKEALAKHIGTGLAATLGMDTESPPDGLIFSTHHIRKDGRLYVLTLCTRKDPDIHFFGNI